MQWNNELYDQKHAFVSKYGEGLIGILKPEAGENILDLGCGTGDLTHQIALSGCNIVGLDGSPEMIEGAKKKFPELAFVVADARDFDLNNTNGNTGEMDAVFSNAVLHWIKKPEAVLERVKIHLKTGGRFVAEFGAKDNVKKIREAIHEVLQEHGFLKQAAIQKWYFPSVAEYAGLLEKHGFEVRFIESYDRPTLLESAGDGIVDWLEMFAGTFFEGISDAKKQELLYEVQERLYDDLYQEGKWMADYKRLRFLAYKL